MKASVVIIYPHLMSPSFLAICPNICANEFGMIPRSSGTVRTPSIVNVLPVPVCPYAKIVPETKISWVKIKVRNAGKSKKF